MSGDRFPHRVGVGPYPHTLPNGQEVWLDTHLVNGSLHKLGRLVEQAGVPANRVVETRFGDGPGGVVVVHATPFRLDAAGVAVLYEIWVPG